MLYQIVNPVITGFAGKKPEEAPSLFGNFFSALVGLLLILAALWAFMNLIQGGLSWISSGGDKSKVEEAQHRITNAIIGLVIVFVIWAAYLVILQFLGLSPIGGGFQIKIPTLF